MLEILSASETLARTLYLMKLDVIIPTYNRSEMLRRTLDSLLAAPVPSDLGVGILVVDNNSKDGTRDVVAEYGRRFPRRVDYLFEGQQGRSHALNAGIAATSGDLIGMIDDDEEVDALWYRRVRDAFLEKQIDFIGGPYVPRWGAEPPVWLPAGYRAVIGWIDGGAEQRTYGKDYDGVLMGGNAVMTRAIYDRVGPYSGALGRTDKRLLAGEDEDMTERLLAAGARGVYLPDLIIYHYIPAERLTKRYHRRWCFWRGVSMGIIDRERRAAVVYLFGVPRYLYGRAARAIPDTVRSLFDGKRDAAARFSSELAIWDLAGFFYGKHFYRGTRSRKPSALYPVTTSRV